MPPSLVVFLQDTTSPTILIFVPPVNSFCNPVAEIIPPVMSILVLPTKSQDTSLSTMLIFVSSVNSSCFPCIVSSTSPISGNVIFVFTSNEPLMIKLLDISPPLFN